MASSTTSDDDSRTTLGTKNDLLQSGGEEDDDDDDDEIPNYTINYTSNTQTQDNICIRERDQPPLTGGGISASQEIRTIHSLLNSSNNNAVVVSDTQSQKLRKYPNTSVLMTSNTDAAFQTLKAVDDTGAASCTQASDKCEPKANAWAHLLDVLHGGVEKGRGSMSRFGFKAHQKPTIYKRKVLDMWKYGIENESKILPELYQYCKRQKTEYDNAIAAEKENSNKEKAINDRLQVDMVGYQERVGARPDGAGPVAELPPGYIGRSGMGRGQHSTNLGLGQPANFGFAHLTATNNENISPLTSNNGTSNNTNSSGATTTAHTPIRTPGRHTPPRGTATLHNNTLESVNSAVQNLNSIVAVSLQRNNNIACPAGGSVGSGDKRKSEIEDLERLIKKHKEDVKFYSDLGEDEDKKKSLDKYRSASDGLEQLLSNNN